MGTPTTAEECITDGDALTAADILTQRRWTSCRLSCSRKSAPLSTAKADSYGEHLKVLTAVVRQCALKSCEQQCHNILQSAVVVESATAEMDADEAFHLEQLSLVLQAMEGASERCRNSLARADHARVQVADSRKEGVSVSLDDVHEDPRGGRAVAELHRR